MNESTLQHFKNKVQQAEKLKKQIAGLQIVIEDLDQALGELKTIQAAQSGETPSRIMLIRSHAQGAGESYDLNSKTNIPREEITMLFAPTLLTSLEALLDQKFKELEEL